jgi:putative Mn2+ efflux pump MntP
MLYEALKARPGAAAEGAGRLAAHEGTGPARDPTRGWSLMALSVATSLDALVVGVSLGLKRATEIWWASAVIGVVAGLMALTGVVVGQHVGRRFGKAAEVVGAVVLMGLGVSFLFW